MTVKVYESQARRVQALVGARCVRAQTGMAQALLLDFGDLAAPDRTGYRSPELSLVADCPWRVESTTAVLAGSGDAAGTGDAALAVCVGKSVTSVAVASPSFGVRVAFGDSLTVLVFPDDPREFTDPSPFPRSGWYVTGRTLPDHWEE